MEKVENSDAMSDGVMNDNSAQEDSKSDDYSWKPMVDILMNATGTYENARGETVKFEIFRGNSKFLLLLTNDGFSFKRYGNKKIKELEFSDTSYDNWYCSCSYLPHLCKAKLHQAGLQIIYDPHESHTHGPEFYDFVRCKLKCKFTEYAISNSGSHFEGTFMRLLTENGIYEEFLKLTSHQKSRLRKLLRDSRRYSDSTKMKQKRTLLSKGVVINKVLEDIQIVEDDVSRREESDSNEIEELDNTTDNDIERSPSVSEGECPALVERMLINAGIFSSTPKKKSFDRESSDGELTDELDVSSSSVATVKFIPSPNKLNVPLKVSDSEPDSTVPWLHDDDSAKETNSSSEMEQDSGVTSLPPYLRKLVSKVPHAVILTNVTNSEGVTLKIEKILFHETILKWFLNDSIFRNLTELERHELHKNYNNNITDLTSTFPFSLGSYDKGIINTDLPYPLQELTKIAPESKSYKKRNKNATISSIFFHNDALDWAFTETLLSRQDDAPNLVDLLYMNPKNCWPQISLEALDNMRIDQSYPFVLPDEMSHLNSVLFESLTVNSLLLPDNIELQCLQAHLKESYELSRSCLVRLLAAASYYMYYTKKSAVANNHSLSVIYRSIISSLRPLIAAQADKLACVIFNIRQELLSRSQYTQNESSLVSLIYGPLFKRNFVE